MKRKNIKVKHIFLGTTILIVVIIAIFSYTLKPDRKLNKFESLIKDSITGAEKIVFAPFKFVINKFDDYKELSDIRKKYQKLLPEVERIDALNAENIELRRPDTGTGRSWDAGRSSPWCNRRDRPARC